VSSKTSKASKPIRLGSIYWLKNCDPLDDDNAKDRPVVVVDYPDSLLETAELIIVVACSTKNRHAEYDQIKLPDRVRIPQTKSGLSRPTWAIPRWHLNVHRDRLNEYKGHLTGSVLKAVIEAYLKRVLPPN
jgi:mRNA-degrading endonuclease toxin of MazEF toxin-antitoxin module